MKIKNNISDLTNMLFETAERINDENITGEDLNQAIQRGKAMTDVAKTIIAVGNMQIEAIKTIHDYGVDSNTPVLTQLTSNE